MAKSARKHAESWGVKLGKDFDQAVAAADVQLNELRQTAIQNALAVAAETPARKGKP
jgi:hypothetical protein